MAEKNVELDTANIEIVDEPPTWKWLICLVVSLGVASLVYGADLFGTAYYYLTLHQELDKSLALNVPLSEVLEFKGYAPLLNKRERQVKALIGVDGYLREGEYDRAYAWASKNGIPQLEGSKDFLAAIKELDANSAKIKNAKDELQEVKLSKQSLASQYAFLASRFASLLKLEQLADDWQQTAAKIAQDESVDISTPFYEKGIFAGLPVLEGIPDDIQSYRLVGSYLPTAAARSVGRSLNWSKSPERQELASMEIDATELGISLVKNDTQLPEAQREFDTAKNAVSKAESTITDSKRTMVSDLAKPELSANAVTVYTFVRNQGMLKDLPEAPQET